MLGMMGRKFMQIVTLIAGSMLDPILAAGAFWVFFKRSSLTEALIFSAVIAFISLIIQATMSATFQPSLAIQMAGVKFVAATIILCSVAFVRAKMNANKTDETG